jgi:molecular chaperone GrpE (heat shock protein)
MLCQQAVRVLQEQLEAGEQGEAGKDPDIELQLEGIKGDAGQQEAADAAAMQEAIDKAAEEIAEDMTQKFEEEMAPVVDNIEAAMQHFGDLDDLLEGPQGWDLSRGVWRESGWREFQNLRKRLENLRELRDLVCAG